MHAGSISANVTPAASSPRATANAQRPRRGSLEIDMNPHVEEALPDHVSVGQIVAEEEGLDARSEEQLEATPRRQEQIDAGGRAEEGAWCDQAFDADVETKSLAEQVGVAKVGA